MATEVTIVWLRNDLRLADHPAFHAAVESGDTVIPLYILDDAAEGAWKRAGASRWWLHHSLKNLGERIEGIGGRLILRRGDTLDQLVRVATESRAQVIHCTRGYEPWQIRQEECLSAQLAGRGITLKRFAGRLLREPNDVKTKEGQPFKVYTPFWRALTTGWSPSRPLPAVQSLTTSKSRITSEPLESWRLLPRKPDWAGGIRKAWRPGEEAAHQLLHNFLDRAVARYAEDRNRPDVPGTSRLSPHLHFGEISPRQCWHAALTAAARNPASEKGVDVFLKELGWREFSYHLLFFQPDLPEAPFRPEFGAFPWVADEEAFEAWKLGARAIRSSMRACVSCGRRAGCTIASA